MKMGITTMTELILGLILGVGGSVAVWLFRSWDRHQGLYTPDKREKESDGIEEDLERELEESNAHDRDGDDDLDVDDVRDTIDRIRTRRDK